MEWEAIEKYLAALSLLSGDTLAKLDLFTNRFSIRHQ